MLNTTNLRVLSLFDGIACGYLALKRAGIPIDAYYAAEINKAAMRIAKFWHPDIQHIGDVRKVHGQDYPNIDVLMGGSPCQNFSMMGRRKGMKTRCNVKVDSYELYTELIAAGYKFEGESYLFWEYERLRREVQPKYFFLENVQMTDEWAHVINTTLGVHYIHINSNKVSAQNRDRYYWTNIPLSEIDDRRITVADIIPSAVMACGTRGRKYKGDKHYTPYTTYRRDDKFNCLVTTPHMTNKYMDIYGDHKVITPEHAEILQTIPVGYTNVPGVSKTQRYEALGNAWTIDVIVKFFENLQIEIPA